jgi:6-pyruvoyl-tetrahydropterin synthase
MFSLEVRDSIMIAHSLPAPFFGPAQGKHGATFTVDVTFYREKLDQHNVVIDIGKAIDVLKAILKPLNYQDLDTLPMFKGILTTTEFLSHYIFEELKKAKSQFGDDGQGVNAIKVMLTENHLAKAGYKGAV